VFQSSKIGGKLLRLTVQSNVQLPLILRLANGQHQTTALNSPSQEDQTKNRKE